MRTSSNNTEGVVCVNDFIPLLLAPLDFLDCIWIRRNAPKSIDPDDGPRPKY